MSVYVSRDQIITAFNAVFDRIWNEDGNDIRKHIVEHELDLLDDEICLSTIYNLLNEILQQPQYDGLIWNYTSGVDNNDNTPYTAGRIAFDIVDELGGLIEPSTGGTYNFDPDQYLDINALVYAISDAEDMLNVYNRTEQQYRGDLFSALANYHEQHKPNFPREGASQDALNFFDQGSNYLAGKTTLDLSNLIVEINMLELSNTDFNQLADFASNYNRLDFHTTENILTAVYFDPTQATRDYWESLYDSNRYGFRDSYDGEQCSVAKKLDKKAANLREAVSFFGKPVLQTHWA